MKLFLLFICSMAVLMSGIKTSIDYKKVNEIKNWEYVNATVMKSFIKEIDTHKGIGYCPIVIVNYFFQKHFQHTELEMGLEPCSPIKSQMRVTLTKYKKGNIISILVNPKKSSEIRTEKYTFDFSFYLGLFIFFLTFGLTIYILFIPADKLSPKNNEDENKLY